MLYQVLLTTSIIFIVLISKKIKLSHWSFNILWSNLGKIFEKKLHPYKKELFKQAQGDVLDVGSGIGPTFKYLIPNKELKNNNKITKVVAIEPNHFMFEKLKKASLLLNDTPCEIYMKTIEDAIKENNIKENSFDTIICNLVLCSVHSPQLILKDIQKLLKSGGRLLFIEHVVSENSICKLLQHLCSPLWSIFFDGCCITRNTGQYIKTMGGWSSVKIDNAKGPCFKYISGLAIKE
ncbi:hypothetical protein ACTFIZ_012582 [Dictyostelium cf. discoideum]